MNARGHRIDGLHNLRMFDIPNRERDVFYQDVHGVWCKYKSARALSVLALVVSS